MTDTAALAAEYGKALFLLTEETGSSEAVVSDVKALLRVILDNRDYMKLLDTPALTKEEKLSLAEKALSGLDVHLKNTVKLLTEKHCAYLTPGVLKAYLSTYEEARGIEHVEAISAVPLTGEQLARLGSKLTRLTGKRIIIKNTVDSQILGGMKLRYMGIQLDGSIRQRLDSFEKSLRSVIV